MAMLTLTMSVTAFVLPLLAIFLSWWSFRWAEIGAPPDGFTGDEPHWDRSVEIIELGKRSRARWCSKISFNSAALLLAATVPMGSAAADHARSLDWSAMSGFTIIAFGIAYALWQTVLLWKDRRANAFSAYFDSGWEMGSLYDRERTEYLYFGLNPMPFWSLPNRRWGEIVRKPSIDDVYAYASKAPKNVSLENPPEPFSESGRLQ